MLVLRLTSIVFWLCIYTEGTHLSAMINCTDSEVSHSPLVKETASIRITSKLLSTSGTPVKETVLGEISRTSPRMSRWRSESDANSHVKYEARYARRVLKNSCHLSVRKGEESFLFLEVALDPCGGELFLCYVEHFGGDGQVLPAAGPINGALDNYPGPMTVTMEPRIPNNIVPVASELRLTCRGPAGSEPRAAGIVWQWATVSSGPDTEPSSDNDLTYTDFVPKYLWDRVLNTTLIKQTLSRIDSRSTAGHGESGDDRRCETYTVQSTLIRTVTETDRYRAYRCIPTLNGKRLEDFAASVRVNTRLPELKLVTNPSSLQLDTSQSWQRYRPLQVICHEQQRPMEPPAAVRITLLHENKVIASAGEIPNPRNDNKDHTTVTTTTTISSFHNIDSSDDNDNPVTKTSNRNNGDSSMVDSRPYVVKNVDIGSQEPLFLCRTVRTVSCHNGGFYRCVFDYTMEVAGAWPVTITQVADVILPVQVSPQRPNMTVEKEKLQYLANTKISISCTAFIGGPELTSNWTWEACNYTGCNASVHDCLFRSCSNNFTDTMGETEAEYQKDTCQYKQSSYVYYTFKEGGPDVIEIRCYVTRGNSSYPSMARNFTVVRSYPLVSVAIPVTLTTGVIVALIVGYLVTRRRYSRLQRRKRMLNRKQQSRTDHFRKRPRLARQPEPKEPPRMTRMMAFRAFMTTAYDVLMDKNEHDVQPRVTRRPPVRRRYSYYHKRPSDSNTVSSAQTKKCRPKRSASAPPDSDIMRTSSVVEVSPNSTTSLPDIAENQCTPKPEEAQ